MTGRTDKLAGAIIQFEIFHAEPTLLRFISFLALVHRTPMPTGIPKSDISLPELRIRHVSINSMLLTCLEILHAVIAGVGADLPVPKRLLPTDRFQVFFRSLQHRLHVCSVFAFSKNCRMHNYLMLLVNYCIGVIPLQYPV